MIFIFKNYLNHRYILWNVDRDRNSPHYNFDLRHFHVVVSVNDFWYVDNMRLVDDKRNVVRNFYYFYLLFATITTTRNNP